MSKIIFLPAIILIMTLASCIKKTPESPQYSSFGVDIVAHRGVHIDSIAPENSLDAIRMAHRAGFKYIEIDLNRTKDNQIIVFHDDEINHVLRYKDNYKKIDPIIYCSSITLSELRENFVYESPDYAMRRPVPTFEEALITMKGLSMFPIIELKESGFYEYPQVWYDGIKKAESILGKGNFIITSLSYQLSKKVREKFPDIIVCSDFILKAEGLHRNRFSYYPDWRLLDPKVIDKQHQQGYTVATWTVDRFIYDSIKKLNIDKILTDDIAPRFDKSDAVFSTHSNNDFADFIVEGKLNNNLITLNKGESITLNKELPSIYFGAIYFSIEAKGEFVIDATDFKLNRNNLSDDFKMYTYQYMLFKKQDITFKISALTDSTKIKSIWFALSEY